MVRTPCCDKTGLKKGAWTPEEDRKLMAYVTRYGCWNWRQLPKFAAEAKEMSSDDDLSPNDKNQEQETEETDINTQNPASSTQIIESPTSTMSPQQASPGDFSSVDNVPAVNWDLISDDDFAFLDAFEAPGGNFWTEPFLSDDYFMPNDFLTPLVDPDSPFYHGEISSPFGFINMDDSSLC
ncbi:hypothetical protein SADUNF_Sadunf13G0115200 [Salix dunnii]|uniref:Uncharacterized protein n=1 Tax=Salix dunnii TaxID=1413687 RepID=A0A835MRM3_9ROSI|nr:hypothetical protein SADUNF_Sadunf13G0115200 [Salix dunnii]